MRELSVGSGETLGLGEDEAAADGVEDLLCKRIAHGVEGGEAHAIGVGGSGRVGVHLVAAEEDVSRVDEGNAVPAEER